MLKELLLQATGKGASDIFINAGKVPAMRLQGTVSPGDIVVDTENINHFRQSILNPEEENIYIEKESFDTSCTLEGIRFRINFFTTLSGPALAVRPIRRGGNIFFEDLHLPAPFLKNLCNCKRGLILITGSTGSGKSTTLAAMINHINRNSYRHVLTLEDPVEYLFEDELCRISQREISKREMFADALRSALRENPDVIVVGEMRDVETMQTAMTAAMTGHLVLATVHTSDTVKAVERIVSMFPEAMRQQASEDIGQCLNAVIAQRLIPAKKDSAMYPVLELLPATPTVKKMIGERDFGGLEETLKRQTASGMQNFNKAVFQLYKDNLITLSNALDCVDNPDEFKLLLKGMETGVDTFKTYYGSNADDRNSVDMKTLLKYAHSFHASDLHLTAGTRPTLRINGALRPLDLPSLTPVDIQQLLFSIITRRQRLELEEKKELDLALSIKLEENAQSVRYRVNGYFQRGSLGIAARVVNS
ncbi:MAG: PilT/PilU family type 4a pilus ATPase, partial [Lentisphaeria bacterium]|nr:PilT/PilU family type 4a pilus ATPase [Lentisphaeria bacterium]